MRTLLVLVVAISTTSGSASFAPSDIIALRAAVAECLKLSPFGDVCKKEHGPIGDWDVSAVRDMSELFSGATEFTADISKWDMSGVFNARQMFYKAKHFNGDLSKWDVSSVTNMREMFTQAYAFNSDISKWHVARVRDFHGMFNMRFIETYVHKAPSFNVDISQWDTSHATDMSNMFYEAVDFNQDLSDWDVTRVRDMTEMFFGAKSFSQSLCGVSWVFARATADDMFKNSGGGAIANEVCPDVTTTTTSTTTITTSTSTSTTTSSTSTPTSTSTSTSTTSEATTKEVVGDDQQQEGVNWAATVAGVMVILVLAFGAFIGAIYVWFLVLKKQNPNLKSFQAVRQVPSVAAHSIRELVSPRNTDTLSLVDETLDDENEFEAENKSVTNSEDGDNQFDGDFEANGQDGDVESGAIDNLGGGIEMVELESKADAPNEDDGITGEPFVAGENAENPDGENAVDGDNQPDGIDISNPEGNLETGDTPSSRRRTTAERQLQDIVDRSVIATPQEKQELVDSL